MTKSINNYMYNSMNILVILMLASVLIFPPIVFESLFAVLTLLSLINLDSQVFKDKKLFYSQFVYFVVMVLIILYHEQNVGRLISGFYVIFASVIIAHSLTKQKVSWSCLVYGCALSTFGGFIFACYQFFILKIGTDIHGFTNRVQFGDIAILIGVMGLLFTHKTKNNSTRLCGILSFAFGLLTSIISGSRGSWSVLPFVGILYLYLFNISLVKAWKYILFILALFISALLITGQYHRFGMIFIDLKDYSQTANLASNSIGSRIEMWKASIEMFKSQPFFGVGDWQLALPSLGKSINTSIIIYNQPHNEYLRNLAMFGLFGFIAFMIFLLAPFFLYSKVNRSAKMILYSLQVMFMIFACTQAIFVHQNSVVLYSFFLGVALFAIRCEHEN